LQWLSLLQCLKNTGMSLKDIKRFAECTTIGDDTIDERLALFESQSIRLGGSRKFATDS